MSGFLGLACVAIAVATTAMVVDVKAGEPVSGNLDGKRVAILATDGFEQSELLEPRKALEAAGAKTFVVSPKSGQIKAWHDNNWGVDVSVDVPLDGAKPEDYDALLLPGGVANPDKLRIEPKAVQFVKAFVVAGKPIGAICHGPWTLIEADAVRGRKMTSWPSLQTDLRNAGAHWTDAEVVTDHGLVTSRKPADIPAFSKQLIAEIAEGSHTPKTSDK
jgi:protease I